MGHPLFRMEISRCSDRQGRDGIVKILRSLLWSPLACGRDTGCCLQPVALSGAHQQNLAQFRDRFFAIVSHHPRMHS